VKENIGEGRGLSQVRIPGRGDGGRDARARAAGRRDPDPGARGAGTLVPVIDARYLLTRIADAYRHVDADHKQGNVVVTMED
jgi:hypothetical protein